MGKIIRMDGKDFTVVGLMENMPDNSHLKAHIVAPFTGYWAQPHKYGQTDAFMTYFKIIVVIATHIHISYESI